MAGVWSRLSGHLSRMAPFRRGIQTGKPRKGGGNYPNATEGGEQGGLDHVRVTFSRWRDKEAYDALFLWGTIIMAPLGLISFYTNTFIGSAKIAPIPEGYEPREDEYEWHPITRFIVRNFQIGEQQAHEMNMHSRWEIWRESAKQRLMKEVKRQMAQEGDYAAYYYHPTATRYARQMRHDRDRVMDTVVGSKV